MALRALLVATGIFGAFAFLAWAIIFWQIIKEGQVILIEPEISILKAEFGMAIALAIFMLFAVVVAIRHKHTGIAERGREDTFGLTKKQEVS